MAREENSLREWFAQNDGKGWVGVNRQALWTPGRKAQVILPVALLWHNARLLQRKEVIKELEE